MDECKRSEKEVIRVVTLAIILMACFGFYCGNLYGTRRVAEQAHVKAAVNEDAQRGESCGHEYCWSDAQIAELYDWRADHGLKRAVVGESCLVGHPNGHQCWAPCKGDGFSITSEVWAYADWKQHRSGD